MNLKKSVEEIRAIADDARRMADRLKNLVKNDPGAETTAQDRRKLKALITKTEDTRRDFRSAARTQRASQIADLKERVRMVKSALNTSGLSTSARNDLEDLLDVNETELSRLQNQEATDFTDLVSTEEQDEIERLLEHAKDEVNEKRKAANAMVVAVKAADVALTIATKLAKAAII